MSRKTLLFIIALISVLAITPVTGCTNSKGRTEDVTIENFENPALNGATGTGKMVEVIDQVEDSFVDLDDDPVDTLLAGAEADVEAGDEDVILEFRVTQNPFSKLGEASAAGKPVIIEFYAPT